MTDIMIKKKGEELNLTALNISKTFIKHHKTYEKHSKERDDVLFYILTTEYLIVLHKGTYNRLFLDVDMRINKYMMKSLILKNRECLICYEYFRECRMCPQCGNIFCLECCDNIDKCPMCRCEFKK